MSDTESKPVGSDWSRLSPLEKSRRVLSRLLGIPTLGLPNYFVFVAGQRLAELRRRKSSEDLPPRSSCDLLLLGGDPFVDGRVRLWDKLAYDLAKDPDFYSYVRRSTASRLRRGDELSAEDIARSFAQEGHAHAVEHAEDYLKEQPKLPPKMAGSWVHLIERDLGRSPVWQLMNLERGDRAGYGVSRGNGRYGSTHIGTAASQIAGSEVVAAIEILDQRASRAPDPALEAETNELLIWLRRAVAGLPQLDRRIITLRLTEGKSFREIGKEFNKSADWAADLFHGVCEQLAVALGRIEANSKERR